jgi:Glycosyltransferase family 87
MTLGFALVVAVAVYFSFEEIGFDPGFPRNPTLGDFGSFYEAGRAALRGENPYGVYALTYFSAVNLNPPFSVLLFMPPAHLAPVVAARLWSIGSALAYVASVVLLLMAYPCSRAPWRLVWALGISAIWGTLALGQIYNYLGLATVGGWLLLRARRPGRAAVLFGLLIAVKVNFAIVPLLLFAAGQRRTALTTLGAALGLSLLPLPLLGWRAYAQWAEALTVGGGVSSQVVQPTNGSLSGLLARLDLRWLGAAAAGILILALVAWSWRRRRPAVQACGVALAASILAAPWRGRATRCSCCPSSSLGAGHSPSRASRASSWYRSAFRSSSPTRGLSSPARPTRGCGWWCWSVFCARARQTRSRRRAWGGAGCRAV